MSTPFTPDAADTSTADFIDLADSGRIVRHGWRRIVAATLGGLAIAAGVVLLAPRRFDGAASVVVKSNESGGSSLLGRLGIPAELAPAALGSAMKSPLETELAILGSRAVLGAVSDSLGLQVRVLAPKGYAPRHLLRPAVYPGPFKKRKLTFERVAGGYRVSGDGVAGEIAPGRPLRTPLGTLTLADGVLPESFTVQLLDREDALKRLDARVSVEKAGGEVVRVGYAAPDSLSAAEVPNAVVGTYLGRRRTVDRSVNQYRAEFLAAQLDSVNVQLSAAERSLRDFQERSGVMVDPELVGKLGLESAERAREQLAANRVEALALDSLLLQTKRGGQSAARNLAGFPSFLRSPAINELLTQITRLESDRARLLERRTPLDPEMVAIGEAISGLEQQFEPVGRAYASSLARQRDELSSQVARFDVQVARLPAAAQQFVRLQRDVKRLGATAVALQSQLLDARLAAVGEGGEARALDVAFPPKRVSFPRPTLTLAAGAAAGLALGTLGVLLAGFLAPRVSGAGDAARATGLPAATLGTGSPLFQAVCRTDGGSIVVPLTARADAAAVARWLSPGAASAPNGAYARPERIRAALAAAALADGPAGTIVEEDGVGVGAEPSSGGALRVLPPLDSPAGAAAIPAGARVVLAAPSDVRRAELAEGVAALRLSGAVPVAVVLA